jgi:hypothetical protein
MAVSDTSCSGRKLEGSKTKEEDILLHEQHIVEEDLNRAG